MTSVFEKESDLVEATVRGSAEKAYVSGIDGLRAVAVISVIAYHLDERFLPGGFSGVDIFFVISGFVVSMATSRLPAQGLRHIFLTFYRRRFLRIMPAALFFLLAMQFIAVLFIPVTSRLTVPDMTAAAATAGFSNIVLWLKAADYFSPAAVLNPFTHTWSLAVEEQFYILFPAFALLIWVRRERGALERLGISAVAACALISLVAAALLTSIDHSFAFYMLPTRFWEMAAGVLLFILVTHRNAPRAVLEPGGAVIFALSVGGLALLIASLAFLSPTNFPFPSALAPILAGVILIYLAFITPNGPLARAFSLPVLRYVGRISYSLYLWHWGVIVLMLWTVGLATPLQKFVAVLVSLVLADLSYRLIERPVRSSAWFAGLPSWQVVLGGIAAAGLTSMAIVGLTILRPELSLSVTSDADIWLPNSIAEDGPCGVERSRQGFSLSGNRYDFTVTTCEGEVDSRRLYVVGDSHAWGYQRMVGNIAREHGLSGTIFMSAGCAVLPEPIASNRRPECAAFVDQALKAVAEVAKPGDILFLPGLRTQRYREYWEAGDKEYAEHFDYSDTMLEAQLAVIEPILDRGTRAILEAPKPVYNYAPFRCADWFNRSNPHCQVAPVSAAEQEVRRAATLKMFERATALEPRLEVWDPFLLLCPGEICSAMRDGFPIVSDGDHLTGYANDFLTPDLWMKIES